MEAAASRQQAPRHDPPAVRSALRGARNQEYAPLQPGLLATFRTFLVISTVANAVGMRLVGPLIGMGGPLRFRYQLLGIGPETWTMLLLLLYTFSPWCRRLMGRAFLPVALAIKGMQPFIGDYLALSGFVPPASSEYFALLSMVRVLLNSEFIVIFTAWQYELAWAFAVGGSQWVLNAATAFPYTRNGSPLYPLYVTMIFTHFITVSGVGIAVGLLIANQRRHAAALDERNRKLAHYASIVEQLAVTQERNRMARELHDTLAHSLSAVAVQIEAAKAMSEADSAAGQQLLEQALQSTRGGLTEARRALHALRASPLEDLGLSLAARDLAESVAARAGLKLDLEIGSHLENLAPEIEQCLYRVLQEALTNIARHANATTIHVALSREDGHVRLAIRDDGCGFDLASVGDTRFGLKGLRERSEHLGGTLIVDSRKGGGTKVALELRAV